MRSGEKIFAVLMILFFWVCLMIGAHREEVRVEVQWNDRPVPVATTHLVEPYIMKMWEKVAWCETHGQWHRDQPNFDGGLGISRVVWLEYRGDEFAPAPHLATPEEQVFIARRIQAMNGVPNYIPDQAGGCHKW